jgi:hypothetical protein
MQTSVSAYQEQPMLAAWVDVSTTRNIAMSDDDLLSRLTNESVDPQGWGVPHNTERNRQANASKSTEHIIAEIESRNAAGKPTWQLRQELARRTGEE